MLRVHARVPGRHARKAAAVTVSAAASAPTADEAAAARGLLAATMERGGALAWGVADADAFDEAPEGLPPRRPAAGRAPGRGRRRQSAAGGGLGEPGPRAPGDDGHERPDQLPRPEDGEVHRGRVRLLRPVRAAGCAQGQPAVPERRAGRGAGGLRIPQPGRPDPAPGVRSAVLLGDRHDLPVPGHVAACRAGLPGACLRRDVGGRGRHALHTGVSVGGRWLPGRADRGRPAGRAPVRRGALHVPRLHALDTGLPEGA